jgi:protein-tyrosine-phosphatase/DNA-binding transcriptional ArsR family regulator
MEMNYIDQLAALAHPQRLAIFRLLMRRYPDAVPAGEIADALGARANTLSAYLSSLRQAGLISQDRQGRSLRYRIAMEHANGLVSFLVDDCCRGRPELCAQIQRNNMMDRKYNVLFICVGNSARSVMAESILRAEGADRFNAFSAGIQPYSQINPFALEMLQAKGHDIAPLRAKNLSEFQRAGAPVMDFVFTVCDRAANEECPAWSGQPISGHWGLPDPVKATGTEAEKRLAFQQTYAALRNRIVAFTSLPFDGLDRVSLQRHVDDLANEMETQ